jgi:hypothetical protein
MTTDFETFATDHQKHVHCADCGGCIIDPIVQQLSRVWCIGCRDKQIAQQVDGEIDAVGSGYHLAVMRSWIQHAALNGDVVKWGSEEFLQLRPQTVADMERLAIRIAGAACTQYGSAPIDMLLFCPNCGEQHVDAPDENTPGWKNPPHRSHLCHFCAHVWRPCDRATNGVATIKTGGKKDGSAIPRIAGL